MVQRYSLIISLLVAMLTITACHRSRLSAGRNDDLHPDIALCYSGKKILISSNNMLRSEYSDNTVIDSAGKAEFTAFLKDHVVPGDTLVIDIVDDEYICGGDTLEYMLMGQMVYNVLDEGLAIVQTSSGEKQNYFLVKKTLYGYACKGRARYSKKIYLIDPETNTVVAKDYIWFRLVSCF